MALLVIAGCIPAQKAIASKTMREAAPGTWTWKKGECTKDTQVYSFSDDGKAMYLYSKDGVVANEKGDLEVDIVYQILDESRSTIRTIIENEYRETENGKPVVWDMNLINDNQFCWRRADWPRGECTASMYRCDSAE